MAFNQQLYNDLYRLRQRIKDRERQLQGRAPTVCSDNALYEIAELCPKKLTQSSPLKFKPSPTRRQKSINHSRKARILPRFLCRRDLKGAFQRRRRGR